MIHEPISGSIHELSLCVTIQRLRLLETHFLFLFTSPVPDSSKNFLTIPSSSSKVPDDFIQFHHSVIIGLTVIHPAIPEDQIHHSSGLLYQLPHAQPSPSGGVDLRVMGSKMVENYDDRVDFTYNIKQCTQNRGITIDKTISLKESIQYPFQLQ